jgi:hypothetical protein
LVKGAPIRVAVVLNGIGVVDYDSGLRLVWLNVTDCAVKDINRFVFVEHYRQWNVLFDEGCGQIGFIASHWLDVDSSPGLDL